MVKLNVILTEIAECATKTEAKSEAQCCAVITVILKVILKGIALIMIMLLLC